MDLASSHEQLLQCPLSRHLLMHHPSQTWVMPQLLKCPEMPVFILLSANLNWSSKKKNKKKTHICMICMSPSFQSCEEVTLHSFS